jgi:ferrous iron transport protein B
MLMGFGCTVPAVMAARTLPSERDRKLTIFLVPFMSCSTKLTIYGFFASAFFPGHAALVTILLYVLGVVLAVISAYLGHTLVFKGEAVPFVMELPNYRMPGLKSVGRLVWNKSKDFISRAFTTIFVASVIIWFLQSFTLRLSFTPDPSVSMLAAIAGVAAPLFAPLGFGDWRVATAHIVGFLAKETVVSTCQVLFGSVSQMVGAITPLAAAGLLVFCLLYTPCVAAIAAIRRELGNKWALGIMAFQCVVAWLCAFVVRLVGMALGL